MNRPIIIVVVVMCLALLGNSSAEVIRWNLGGSGPPWATWTAQNTLADIVSDPAVLQPLELKPDENIVSKLLWTRYKFPIVSYFRSGMPRVWPGTGEISTPKGLNLMTTVDGDPTTAQRPIGNNFFTLDLGAPVPAERIVFYPPVGVDPFTQEPYRPNFRLAAYEVSATNDALFLENETGGYHALDVRLASVEQNFDAIVEINFQRQNLRFFRLKAFTDHSRERSLAEIEIYGRGFVSQATWLSQVIDMGEPVNIGQVMFGTSTWRLEGGQRRPATNIQAQATIEIKSGRDDTPITYLTYNDLSQLVEVSAADYERLKPRVYGYDPPAVGWRGPITEDANQWSFWSRPLSDSGQAPQIPAGQYIQLRVRLETKQVEEMIQMDSLALEASPLLADRILGEVAVSADPSPASQVAQVPIGEQTEFIYALRGQFTDGQPGFNAVRIQTPAPSIFKGLTSGDLAVAVTPDSVVQESQGFVVYLPQQIGPGTASSIQIRLETSLYRAAGNFLAEVFVQGDTGFPQQAQAGDAHEELGTNETRVLALAASLGTVLSTLDVRPTVFTPQGDGVNDQADIFYTLFNTQTHTNIQATVYSLAGYQVRQLANDQQFVGPQALRWDGRDESGQVVPPGLYLIQVEAQTDKGQQARTRLVAIAY